MKYCIVSYVIMLLLDKSLFEGYFPDFWCIGYATPLPKTGDLMDTQKNHAMLAFTL